MPDRPVIFGAIGRFHQQKGFDTLIAAFRSPALAETQLIIAGAGDQEPFLRKLAGDAPNIKFIGPEKDPAAFYTQVDCVIIPSRWEAFGLVASEAMAAGRVVIASDIDGLTEQARDYGVLIKPDNAIALEEAMLRVNALEPEQLKAIGEGARTATLGRYDMMIEAWRRQLAERPYPARMDNKTSNQLWKKMEIGRNI